MIALFYHIQLTISTPSSALTGYHPPPASPLRHRDVRAIAKRKFLDDQGKRRTPPRHPQITPAPHRGRSFPIACTRERSAPLDVNTCLRISTFQRISW